MMNYKYKLNKVISMGSIVFPFSEDLFHGVIGDQLLRGFDKRSLMACAGTSKQLNSIVMDYLRRNVIRPLFGPEVEVPREILLMKVLLAIQVFLLRKKFGNQYYIKTHLLF